MQSFSNRVCNGAGTIKGISSGLFAFKKTKRHCTIIKLSSHFTTRAAHLHLTPTMFDDHAHSKMARLVETDLSTRIYRVSSGLNESLSTIANEPSVGMYRIQENVLGVVPKLIEDEQTLDGLNQRVGGCNFDLDNDREVVQAMRDIKQFRDINNTLSKAIAMKQQLNRLETERKLVESTEQGNASPVTIRVKHGGHVTPGLMPHSTYSINDTPSYQNSNTGDFSGINIRPKSFK